MSSLGYCSNCKKNVIKKKENFNFLMAFILAFTGIGLIIYILYYIDRKPKYYVNCDTLCQPLQLVNQSQQIQELEHLTRKLIVDEKIKFCYNCGSE